MRLATIRTGGATAAVRIDGDEAVELGVADVGELLTVPGWRTLPGTGVRHAVAGLDYAPVVPRPGKVICVGLNYRGHILEMGRELPTHPTLFTKFPAALVGAHDDVVLPAESTQMDWEGELAVVIGAHIRRATPAEALAAVAGYSVLNDVTARDWQYRTGQWLQGKTWETTTPFGPHLVTDVTGEMVLETLVDSQAVQCASVADLLFSPTELISYLSTVITLEPGDVIATGTPGGVGHARKPPRYLTDGSVLTTRITGVGECRNICRTEKTYGF
jgi:acylpyruvate hydrolase